MRLFILIVIAAVAAGCANTDASPSANDILKNNPEADIFQWENVVYANAESAGWIEAEDFPKGEQIGEVQRTSKNPYRFQDGSASQLETGSAVYRSENGDNHLTIDTEEGVVVYIGLIEEG